METELVIDKKKYKISSKNRYNNKTAKTQIVIGTSLRKNHNQIIRLQNKDYGTTKSWSTYTIARDGTIYQHFDDKYYSDFIGIKDGDLHSISIVLENMGVLFETVSGEFINWINEVCDSENVVKKQWQGFNYWERFPNSQINSFLYLCDMLCVKYSIPKKIIEFNHFHKDISKFRGIVFKGNYIDESTDTTPLLEISLLNKLLHNENE